MLTDDHGTDGFICNLTHSHQPHMRYRRSRGTHLQLVRKHSRQSDGIQQRTGTQHLVPREARHPLRHCRQDVDGIGDKEQDGVGPDWLHPIQDALQHLEVPVDQIQPRIPRPLLRSSRDDRDLRLCCILQRPLPDPYILEERPVRQIIHLCTAEGFVDVHEDEVADDSTEEKRMRDC